MRIAALYSLLALVATIANIGGQVLTIAVYHGPYPVYASIIFGTAVGLSLKYVLDKRYIFRFQARGLAHDAQVFMLYTLMGVLTTLIFWLVELAFHVYFGSAKMRYLGGAIGLAIGYFTKYQLDKRYVFVAGTADRAT